MSAEARLAALGIELPAAPAPLGSYVPARRAGGLLYLSGAGPLGPEGLVTGKVGSDLTLEEGVEAARLTGLQLLANLHEHAGGLDNVRGIVKLLGMVNAAPGFTDVPQVINGCSDLLVEVFGDAGRHARSAVGVAELPLGIAVEIELIAEVLQ